MRIFPIILNNVKYYYNVNENSAMGTKELQTRQKQILRKWIPDAARELFITAGYEGVSMHHIFGEVEYPPTTTCFYFKDKAYLFRCFCNEAFAKRIKQFEALHSVRATFFSIV